MADLAYQRLHSAEIWYRSEHQQESVNLIVRRQDHDKARYLIAPLMLPPESHRIRDVIICLVCGGVVAWLAHLAWGTWNGQLLVGPDQRALVSAIVPLAGFCAGSLLGLMGVLLTMLSCQRR